MVTVISGMRQSAVVKLLWDTCQSRNRGALTSPVGYEIPRVALALSGIGEIRNRFGPARSVNGGWGRY